MGTKTRTGANTRRERNKPQGLPIVVQEEKRLEPIPRDACAYSLRFGLSRRSPAEVLKGSESEAGRLQSGRVKHVSFFSPQNCTVFIRPRRTSIFSSLRPTMSANQERVSLVCRLANRSESKVRLPATLGSD
jgi:hypothetical protein